MYILDKSGYRGACMYILCREKKPSLVRPFIIRTNSLVLSLNPAGSWLFFSFTAEMMADMSYVPPCQPSVITGPALGTQATTPDHHQPSWGGPPAHQLTPTMTTPSLTTGASTSSGATKMRGLGPWVGDTAARSGDHREREGLEGPGRYIFTFLYLEQIYHSLWERWETDLRDWD